MAQQWYVQVQGREYGPLSNADLKQFAAEGRIQADTPMRLAHENTWSKAGRLKGLFSVPAAAPAADIPPVSDGLDFLNEPSPRATVSSNSASAPKPAPAPTKSTSSAPARGGNQAKSAAAQTANKAAKKKQFNMILGGVVALVAVVVILLASGVFFSSEQGRLERAVAERNKQGPFMFNSYVQVDKLQAAPELTCIFHCSVKGDLTEEYKREFQQAFVKQYKNDNSKDSLVKKGVKLKVRLKNSAGKLIHEFAV